MRGKMHAALGLTFGAACGTAFFQDDITKGAIFLAACTLGSLIPDVDLPTSTIGKAFRPLSGAIYHVCGHRGFVHSLLCSVLITMLTGFTESYFYPAYGEAFMFGLFSGYLLHLLQDSCTPYGVQWLWPFRHRFHIPFGWCRYESQVRYWILTVVIFLVTTGIVFYAGMFSGILSA